VSATVRMDSASHPPAWQSSRSEVIDIWQWLQRIACGTVGTVRLEDHGFDMASGVRSASRCGAWVLGVRIATGRMLRRVPLTRVSTPTWPSLALGTTRVKPKSLAGRSATSFEPVNGRIRAITADRRLFTGCRSVARGMRAARAMNRVSLAGSALLLGLWSGCSSGEDHDVEASAATGGSDSVATGGRTSASTGGAENEAGAAGSACAALELEAEMAATLDAVAKETAITTDPDFTVLLVAADGRRFTHDAGDFTGELRFDSASTSKWITAAVILDLVDRGLLTLETRASELLSFWTGSDPTLRDLLSFTSGYSEEPLCVNAPRSEFAVCVERIFELNVGATPPSGTEFYYSSSHLQIAGLMAIRASGAADWQGVWADFQERTGLFPSSSYDLPSLQNPRLAGGMTLNGIEYLDFLSALYRGELLSAEMRAALLSNQRGTASVGYSPIWSAASEDWSYGLGNWLECPTATEPGSSDCGAGHRNSSPGAYGAYPFIDFDHAYFGIVARRGTLGGAREGIAIFRSIAENAARWSAAVCP
jgi:CubicO group peptidase (beta-lactamase class C family)